VARELFLIAELLEQLDCLLHILARASDRHLKVLRYSNRIARACESVLRCTVVCHLKIKVEVNVS
jgi:hypothetical protein